MLKLDHIHYDDLRKMKTFLKWLWQILAIINDSFILLFPDTSKARIVNHKMYFFHGFYTVIRSARPKVICTETLKTTQNMQLSL